MDTYTYTRARARPCETHCELDGVQTCETCCASCGCFFNQQGFSILPLCAAGNFKLPHPRKVHTYIYTKYRRASSSGASSNLNAAFGLRFPTDSRLRRGCAAGSCLGIVASLFGGRGATSNSSGSSGTPSNKPMSLFAHSARLSLLTVLTRVATPSSPMSRASPSAGSALISTGLCAPSGVGPRGCSV